MCLATQLTSEQLKEIIEDETHTDQGVWGGLEVSGGWSGCARSR